MLIQIIHPIATFILKRITWIWYASNLGISWATLCDTEENVPRCNERFRGVTNSQGPRSKGAERGFAFPIMHFACAECFAAYEVHSPSERVVAFF